MDIKNLLGKRVLLKIGERFSSKIDEYKVLEISPSGNWVKLMNIYGNKYWRSITEISLIEELKPIENRPK